MFARMQCNFCQPSSLAILLLARWERRSKLLSVFLASNSFAGKVVRWKMEVGSTGRREGISGGS